MNEYIISQNCNGVHYAYSRGRFWRWDESAHVWKESHLLAQKFGKAKTVEKRLTPEAFLTSNEFIPMDDYELPDQMLTALRDAKPCRNAPVEPVEECTAPIPANTADVAEPCGNVPASPSFDFSALGDLSGQAAEADHQFDLHYGTAQDEYLISCIYLARVHALTAKAGRYGGGTWTKWYESKGLSEGSARSMVKNGDAFKSATVAELKCLPELTRKDLNLIARSGCAEQLTAAAGDSQRVQELLAQLKAEKSRADTAEAHLEAAHADINGLTERAQKAESERDKARADQLSTAKDCNRLGLKVSQEKDRADKAEAREEEAWNLRESASQKYNAALADVNNLAAANQRKNKELEAVKKDLRDAQDALKHQPITAVVDKDEVKRQAEALSRNAVQEARQQAAEAQARLRQYQEDAEGLLAPAQACAQQAQFIADSVRAMYLNWFGSAVAADASLAQMGTPLYAVCGEIMSSLEEGNTINPTAAGSEEDAEREALFE